MSIFLYPKQQHTRQYLPRLFKNYRSYKRYLRAEFSRVCVYCRQPDSSAPNLNFGVDHYRPKSIVRFAKLTNQYDNLYYCCGNCNSRKNNYWPTDEKIGPYIVNPCDHQMADHLRFNAKDGEIKSRSKDGGFTEELLQLNEPIVTQFRLHVLKMVSLLQKEMAERKSQIADAKKLHSNNKITAIELGGIVAEATQELAELQKHIEIQTGTGPLPPGRL